MTKQNYYHKQLVTYEITEKKFKRYIQRNNLPYDKIIDKRLEIIRRKYLLRKGGE